LAEDRPCRRCPSCHRIQAGSHADVQTVAKARTGILIDQVRALQHAASLKPFEGRSRVFLLDGVEAFTHDAANSLLKILEEPPEDLLLLLLTADAEAVPETVQSRCQRIDLLPVPREEVLAVLREEGVSPPEAEEIARAAGGRIGWARRAARSPDLLEGRRQRRQELMALAEARLAVRLQQAEQMAGAFFRDRDGVLEELRLWMEGWRDLLLVRAGVPDGAASPEPAEGSPSYSLEEVLAVLRRIEETAQALEANANPRLALEALMLALPRSVP
jgi:DNA polymerase-3 subunit delta'